MRGSILPDPNAAGPGGWSLFRHALPRFCPATGSKDFRTALSLILPARMPRARCIPSIDTRSSRQRAVLDSPRGLAPDDGRLARVELRRAPLLCLGRPLGPPRDLFWIHRGHPQSRTRAARPASIEGPDLEAGAGRRLGGGTRRPRPACHLAVPAHGELVAFGPAQAAPTTRRAVDLGRALASRGPDQATLDAGIVWRRRADGSWPWRRVVGAGWMAAGGRGAKCM